MNHYLRLLVICCFGFAGALFADKVVYESGGRDLTLEGVIVEETADNVEIEWDLNQSVKIPRSTVTSIERGPHPVIECHKLYIAALENKTVENWLEVGRFAAESKADLSNYKNEAFEQVLKLTPDNEEAHKALGHIKHKGQWCTVREKRLSQQWEKRVGDLQKEFIGRPWAVVPPITTQYYTLKCNSTESVESRYNAFLKNAIFPLYNRLFPKTKFKWYNKEPGKIYIIANVGEFRDFTMVPQGVGGFFNPQDNEVFAFHGSFGIRGTTLHVLAHEALHVYQSRIFKEMSSSPTWLMEGMAVYFGDGAQFGFTFRDDESAFTPDAISINPPHDRVTPLRMMIQAKKYLPVKKLLLIPHRAFSGLFYSNAWLMVYWCLDGKKLGAHNGEGREMFDAYLTHVSTLDVKGGFDNPKHLLKEAAFFSDLVKKHLGKDIDAWDEELKQFVLDLKLEPVGRWNRERQIWTGLGLSLRCPSGFKIISQENLFPGEVVGFGARIGDYPRIAVCARGNAFLIRTKPDFVKKSLIRELYTDIEWVEECKYTDDTIWPDGTVEAVFLGQRRKNSLPGVDGEKEASPKVKVRIRATATASRIYVFSCEAPEKKFDTYNEKYFDSFLTGRSVQLQQ